MLVAAVSTEDTTVHRFWRCAHSVMFWELLRNSVGAALAESPPDVDSGCLLRGWLLEWLACDEEKAQVFRGIYELWLVINSAKDYLKLEDPEHIKDRV